jgi:hypothetical protein
MLQYLDGQTLLGRDLDKNMVKYMDLLLGNDTVLGIVPS